MSPRIRFVIAGVVCASAVVWASRIAAAQAAAPTVPVEYATLKAMRLSGQAAHVSGLSLTRDRVTMTFTGTFHFVEPIDGRVTGAVFVGDGRFEAETPPGAFEADRVKRLLGAERIESDFRTAVVRWTDDTYDVIGATASAVPPVEQAVRVAEQFERRFLQETGINLSARLAMSLLNQETPGVFLAQVDGGRRNRFTYMLDHQGRTLVSAFGINAGEKGVIFQHDSALRFNEVWAAFYSAADYARGAVEYSDAHDLIDIERYALTIDLREFDREMVLSGAVETVAKRAGTRVVNFVIGEALSARNDERLDHQLRVRGIQVAGQPVAWAMEDWEGGFSVFLPEPTTAGQRLVVSLDLAGDFIDDQEVVREARYPLDNVTWLPRHSYLDRATFDLTFRHRTRDQVVSIGQRSPTVVDPEEPRASISKFSMSQPASLAVFALGPFEPKVAQVTWEAGGAPIPLVFNSVPSRVAAIKHEFMLAELDNAVRYFAAMFGPYPYETFGAAFHPYLFGQGFPTLLMIPPVDVEDKVVHAFIAHETAHQWWGNIVAWRSYRDQWLSEGFAEYSGMLYAGLRAREGAKGLADMIREHRDSLLDRPRTVLGVGDGRLNDLGPVSYGLRLQSTRTVDAYQTLVYNKGALVLRMLHFLFSDPSTGDDSRFVAMMRDFVDAHRNKAARTEDFWAVASRHFAGTPIAQRVGVANLDWFFRQWVFGTGLPSYHLDYAVENKEDGVYLSGTLSQTGVPEGFVMILPLVMGFDGDQEARTVVVARGASTPFTLKLPARPRRVELDPQAWVLSEKTTAKGRR
jgi:hypothetical protein